MDKLRQVHEPELEAIEIGAGILGTGGGGNPYIGKLRCRLELRRGRRIDVIPLDELDDDALNKEVQLRPRTVFTRARVQGDVDRLVTLYRRSGLFNVRIEPYSKEAMQMAGGTVTNARSASDTQPLVLVKFQCERPISDIRTGENPHDTGYRVSSVQE